MSTPGLRAVLSLCSIHGTGSQARLVARRTRHEPLTFLLLTSASPYRTCAGEFKVKTIGWPIPLRQPRPKYTCLDVDDEGEGDEGRAKWRAGPGRGWRPRSVLVYGVDV